MKKSEMIEKIKESLPWMNTIFAEAVLKVIEDQGMLPPVVHLWDGKKLDKKETSTMFEQAWENYYADWEPEDEN